MSHVSVVKAAVSDLDALEKALTKFPDARAALVRGAKQFEYYAGSKSPCLHKITVTGTRYEIGLQQSEANTPDTFSFACDFYDSTLARHFGRNLEGLQNEYLATVAEDRLASAGWMVRREVEGEQIHVYANR